MVSAHAEISIGLADKFNRCVHGKHWHTTVYHLSAAIGENICDGTATAFVYTTKLTGLPRHIVVLKGTAKLSEEFGVGIVGTAFAAGTGKFAQAYTLAEESGVAAIHDFREGQAPLSRLRRAPGLRQVRDER